MDLNKAERELIVALAGIEGFAGYSKILEILVETDKDTEEYRAITYAALKEVYGEVLPFKVTFTPVSMEEIWAENV